MRILEIIPWVAAPSLLAYEREFVPDFVEVRGLDAGVLAESSLDLARTLPDTLDAIVQAERDGFDAVVLGCFGDPGISEARELVSVPVVGPMRAALHLAGMLGHRTLVLTPQIRHLRWITWRNVVTYGFEARTVIRGLDVSVAEALASYDHYKRTGEDDGLIAQMAEVCLRAVEQDAVDTVVLGCGGIKWMRPALEGVLGEAGQSLPVINPLVAAVEMAQALASIKTGSR